MRIFFGLITIFLVTGCSGMMRAPAKPAEQTAPPAVAEPAAEVRPEAPRPSVTETPVAKTLPAAKPPAMVPPPATTVEPPTPKQKPEPAPGAAKPAPAPAAPALDLTGLETRLKETKAIGVFTKLTLKNQVDDLLDQFRAHYQGRAGTTLAELRQPYDRLLLKVLALLQDGDPQLARDIVASREAIWGILADPVKFAAL